MIIQKLFPTKDIDYLQATLKAHDNNVDEAIAFIESQDEDKESLR